ncbi:uncharacterized protein LOC131855533 [Achroia grisella]|uniref:uncharacterized protein LOC131855533 n=1 Tax=Achroia grisella TaxID=688607 RepID=UPI0027D25C69|nr:uncharacterized protein LOC131855533 [Achroia grisella]
MAVTSARNVVNLKEQHFEHENARIDKYTLGDELPAQLAELGLRSRKMTQPTFTIRRITLEDTDAAVQFLRNFFFLDEPMNRAVNLLETPESRCIELEEYSSSSIVQELSVAAVDEKGEFIGIIINGLVRREEVDYTDKSEECSNQKFRRILKVLDHLNREAKIFEKLPKSCDKVLEIRIASTHSAWRGRGLMRVLCEESERIAKEVGAGALRMDTTSAYSAAAAERLNYKSVYEVLYSDLSYAPKPQAPHLEARVYVKELSPIVPAETRTWTMAQPTYTVEPVCADDVQNVMKLLKKTFYIDEPLNETVELCDTDGICAELDEYCTHSLLEGLSFKAIDNEHNIVGVIINGISPLKEDDNGNDLLSQAQRCQNKKFQKILHILALREQSARLWEKFPEEQRLVEVKVVATDQNWRKRGIMTALVKETERVTEQKGIRLIRMDTSSAYSAMSAERLGFTCVYQVLYSELKLDGKPLIVPKSPHLYDKVFIKKIF